MADDFFQVRENIIENSRFRLGFFYVTPLLSLENVGYSTNIYQYDEIPKPDWTADLGVDLRLATLLGKRFILILKDNPYYSFYLENKSEEAWNNKLQFSAYSFLGAFNLKFSLDRDDLRQLPSAEFGVRVRHQVSREKLSLDYGNHQRFYLNMYGEQSRMTYQDEDYLGDVDLQQLLDQKQYQLGMNINKVIFSRTILFLNLEYFQYRFLNYADRDGEGELINLGLIFPEIGNITGSFRLGYRFNKPENPQYAEYSTLYGSGEVKLRLWRRFRLSVEYLVDNSFSFYQPDNYYNQRTIIGGIEFYLTRRFKLGYRHQYGLLLFKSLETGNAEREDRIQQSRYFMGIKIFKKMGIGIEYSLYRAESDVLDYSRSYDFIGGYITYDF